MCNFRLIGDPGEMFYTLTSNFREFKEYLSQKGYDEEDLKLSTNVLDDCTDFIVKNYKESNELLEKTEGYEKVYERIESCSINSAKLVVKVIEKIGKDI